MKLTATIIWLSTCEVLGRAYPDLYFHYTIGILFCGLIFVVNNIDRFRKKD